MYYHKYTIINVPAYISQTNALRYEHIEVEITFLSSFKSTIILQTRHNAY